MNTLVVLPAVNEILDSARILEAQGFKFTPERVQALVTICLEAITLANLEPASMRIH